MRPHQKGPAIPGADDVEVCSETLQVGVCHVVHSRSPSPCHVALKLKQPLHKAAA